jgi:ATP-binding cassette subfamily B protein
VLDRGRIVEEGSHEKLIELDNGLYRRLFERQALGLKTGRAELEKAMAANTGRPASGCVNDSSLITGR